MAGGKYLQQKSPKAGAKKASKQMVNHYDQDMFPDFNNKPNGRKGKKVLVIVLIIILLLIVVGIVAGIIYYNSVLSMMSRPEDVTVETLSDDELAELLGISTETTEAVTETTSPEETWPKIVSDQNVTNIMVIGQAAREGEEHRLADSNILISINREQKTLTMTSILRDLRVNIPAYEGHQAGFNRINVVYHLGSYYTGKVSSSMDMISMCIENNFGVHVDHVVEIDFDMFNEIVNLLGGITVDLSKAEVDYLKYYYPSIFDEDMQEGTHLLNGWQSLGYARMRKVGNGDWDRTERQRFIITQLLGKLKDMGIMDIHAMFQTILPRIVTNMTNEEITNYAFEFIPMLKDLTIQSFRIPADGTWWSTDLDPDGVHNYVIDTNLYNNGKLLQEMIGYNNETE